MPLQQLRRVNSHPQMGGQPVGGWPNGGSSNRNPPGGLPLNPLVEFYEWLALNPRIFMPLWYPPIGVWSKLASKLPCQKLQHPTFVKDINLNVHIRAFKKAIKANGETVKADIINLFGFTL
jgi:hypothetical protein